MGISGVYLVPESSKLFENNRLIWETLSVMLNTERADTIKLITGDFNSRTHQFMWNNMKRTNIDKKKPNKQGRTLLNFCEKENIIILNGLKINRKEKRRQQQFESLWTYEDIKGKSVIDYSLIEIHLLDKINNVFIDDDIWQICNTQHRSVITDINLELLTT